jgi:hypothetical protein
LRRLSAAAWEHRVYRVFFAMDELKGKGLKVGGCVLYAAVVRQKIS